MDKLVYNLDDDLESVSFEIGGKARNLKILNESGLKVPEWFVITSSSFDQFVSDNNIKISALESLRDIEVEEIFLKGEFRDSFKEELNSYLSSPFFSDLVSVRSSGVEEDARDASFAGQFSSYLFVKGVPQILSSIKRCYASAFSERIRTYRKEKNIKTGIIRMGVIVQKMITPTSSGVLFTRNPIDVKDLDSFLVSASFGVGEGVVSGLVTCDEFKVDRNTFDIISEEIHKKDFRLDFFEGKMVQVKNNLPNAKSLTLTQIKELGKSALFLEKKLGSPQDIEFAIFNDEVYFLQTRPVAHLPNLAFYNEKILGKTPTIWDNSNIIESYSGVTSPLTFSFASYAYNEVYKQFLSFMGVKKTAIEKKDAVFRNLLGLIRGRIYYNLINWYDLVLMLPGSENNKGFLETMMGVKKDLDSDAAKLFDNLELKDKKTSALSKLVIAGKTLHSILFIKKIVKKFQHDFGVTYDKLHKKDFGKDSLSELGELYSFLEGVILKNWKAPIINDYLCMIFFGLLTKLSSKWLPEDIVKSGVQNDLLCGQGNIESTEPTKMLMRLAREIDQSQKELRESILSKTPDELVEDKKMMELIHPFLDKFGFRCANELKLEDNDLHDDPRFVFYTLKNYIEMKSYDVEKMEIREIEIKEGAEKKIKQNLFGIKRFIYFKILKHARLAVKNRENLRFLRTKIFGITRHIFRSVGEHFYKLGLLEARDDVFYLRLEEIRNIIEGRSLGDDYKKLSLSRKEKFNEYKKTPPPPDRFITYGASGVYNFYPSILNANDLLADLYVSNDPSVLMGTSCCPGTATGKVRVAKEFKDAEGLRGDILVTERTDPGWVPLYPSCKALVIERGSLLSHSAVVARELGLPTIIGVNGGLMERLKTGDEVFVDATHGTVKILDNENNN